MSNTSIGKQRFIYFLNQAKVILDKSEVSENPALVIYEENIRTPFFMLEALSRFYKKIHNPKKFAKLDIYFKQIEDCLGRIDYYDGFYKEFITQKNMPSPVTDYLKKKKQDEIDALNRVLKKKNWIEKKGGRIAKIIKSLDEVDWLNTEDDTNATKDIYQKDVNKIIEKYKNGEIKFNDIESDIHELRRELRWLSIYPQCFRGLMQLKPADDTPVFLQKYLTPEIISSPYNVMPDGNNLQKHILLSSNYFYALSWIIAELGKIKDNGLKVMVTEEALINVYKTDQKDVEQLAYSVCGNTQMTIPEILESAKKIIIPFFDDAILENLVG
ncbi:MAG: hypothetical protein Q8891_08220 [Bacteroidota bacterium]|nr:hypothetical protein [Bacteroidota bacterium]